MKAATSWFVCFRRDPKTGRVERDYAHIRTLQDAIDMLLPGHVEVGWMIREETHGSGSSSKSWFRVLRVWVPYLDGGVVRVREEAAEAA